MTIGIGGAGSKIAFRQDPEAIIVNVSETELSKLPAKQRILAVLHSTVGQLRGSGKNPHIGRDAYLSVKPEILRHCRGNIIVSSTGGGTGHGITACILEQIAHEEKLALGERTMFLFVLPYANMEPSEFVVNTTDFLQGPVTEAIDSGNTGNILLYSNKAKFEAKMAEEEFNTTLAENFNTFLAIPDKNDANRLLDGHIDHEDFMVYTAKPYFNYFTYFTFDPEQDFGKQLEANANVLLLPPENPIEAMFLLEMPPGESPTPFYDILEYFVPGNVTPIYSVIENPRLKKPFVTVSMLYSRKPAELVEDFNQISHEHTKAKVRKSLEQHVTLARLEVNLESEAKRVAKQRGTSENDILAVLRRLGKLQ